MLILHSDGGLRPPWGVVKTETPSAVGLAGFYLDGLGIEEFAPVGVEVRLAACSTARGDLYRARVRTPIDQYLKMPVAVREDAVGRLEVFLRGIRERI